MRRGAGGAATGTVTPGIGVVSSISGAAVTYAKGGPVGTPVNTELGSGGLGDNGVNGVSAGIVGIVIVRYLTGTMTATGGTITTSGLYTIHTFTSSGTFTVTS